MQTQIRLFLKKQSDQGLPFLLFWQVFCEFQPFENRKWRSSLIRVYTSCNCHSNPTFTHQVVIDSLEFRDKYNEWCMYIIIWASTRENLSSEVWEQQRHRPACASAQSDQCLCFRFLETIISKLATCKFSTFLLVYVAEQAGLNLVLSETPKTGFLAARPI